MSFNVDRGVEYDAALGESSDSQVWPLADPNIGDEERGVTNERRLGDAGLAHVREDGAGRVGRGVGQRAVVFCLQGELWRDCTAEPQVEAPSATSFPSNADVSEKRDLLGGIMTYDSEDDREEERSQGVREVDHVEVQQGFVVRFARHGRKYRRQARRDQNRAGRVCSSGTSPAEKSRPSSGPPSVPDSTSTSSSSSRKMDAIVCASDGATAAVALPRHSLDDTRRAGIRHDECATHRVWDSQSAKGKKGGQHNTPRHPPRHMQPAPEVPRWSVEDEAGLPKKSGMDTKTTRPLRKPCSNTERETPRKTADTRLRAAPATPDEGGRKKNKPRK
ncbi:hypothetical protein C8J57DRAFT_1478607 [Mycena rebaudengoi]|nr:hypothetical protein C8J57DRAFT_1478607 [Mycena rebaudengoi]